MKKLICTLLLIIILVSGTSVLANGISQDIFDFNKGSDYSSWQYYEMAQALVKKYPDILNLEVIGHSRDKKPLYAITMTGNIEDTILREDYKTYREHYYVEGGNHSRETVNTAIIIKTIENYAKDYYDDSVIKEFNLKSELQKAVIHFIPLVNPDGFDLVKFGPSSVKTETGKKLFSLVNSSNYKRFKANIAGVDLNRNFPDNYYDIKTKTWIDKFQKYPNNFHSYTPSKEFYSGPYGGSEPETQAIMEYVKTYDFRNLLSYHSQGEIIYSSKYWFSNDYNKRAGKLAEIISKVSGYGWVDKNPPSTGKGSGYFADYAVSETLKPTLTIETTKGVTPAPQSYYEKAYKETYLLPLYAMKHGREVGYFKYRLYVDNVYVRDFNEYIYAEAHASKHENAIIIEGKGIPEYRLIVPMTRLEAVTALIGQYYDLTSLTVNALDTFNDTKEIIPSFVKNHKISYGYNGNFNGNENITPVEVATMIFRIHNDLGYTIDTSYKDYVLANKYQDWAKDAVKYVLHNKYMTEEMLETNKFNSRWLKID